MTKRQDLYLQRRSRSERSDQRQPNQAKSISHEPRASPDSTALTSRIEFPTMTGGVMKRLLNPELALGFLIATLLWIGVLGWQASYAPTNSEKRQCEETARKSGHRSEECKSVWE